MQTISYISQSKIDDNLPKPVSLKIGSVIIPENNQEMPEKENATISKPQSNPYGGIIVDEDSSA